MLRSVTTTVHFLVQTFSDFSIAIIKHYAYGNFHNYRFIWGYIYRGVGVPHGYVGKEGATDRHGDWKQIAKGSHFKPQTRNREE